MCLPTSFHSANPALSPPMPPTPWKTLSTREVYRNRWTRVNEDIAEMPNGKTTIYGGVECGQCVDMVPQGGIYGY